MGLVSKIFKAAVITTGAVVADQALTGGQGKDFLNEAMKNNGLGEIKDYPFADGILQATQDLTKNITTSLKGILPPNYQNQANNIVGGSALTLGALAVIGNPMRFFSKPYPDAYKHAVKIGEKTASDAGRTLMGKRKISAQEVGSAITKEIQDLYTKSDLIKNFMDNGFTKNGPFIDPHDALRKTEADLRQDLNNGNMTQEQYAELKTIKKAIKKFDDNKLSWEKFSDLSEQQVAAMIPSATEESTSPSFFRKAFMLTTGAIITDTVIGNGYFTRELGQQITNLTGFQAPADMARSISDFARNGLGEVLENTTSVALDAGVKFGETLGIDAGYGKAIAAIAGGGLLTGLLGKIGGNLGGGAGAVAGMATALSIIWGTMENSNIDVDYSRDNFLFGNPSGTNGGYAGLWDKYIGTPTR